MSKQLFVFRSPIDSNNYIFKDGSRAAFVAGRYATDDSKKAAELQAEIEAGNYMFMPGTEEDKLIAESGGDPLAALRDKFFKEFQAEQSRQQQELAEGKAHGEIPKAPLMVGNTKTIQDVTANQGKK